MAEEPAYDYDYFVIGGGSGGLASAKAAAAHGAKVAVADFVKPSPAGTTWGLGGTCVNVGCIPKKLMHIGGHYREVMWDASHLGWDTKASHSWDKMIESVTNYIKSINWGAKNELMSKEVKYFNSFATFVDPHTLKLVNKKGREETVTAKNICIACGGRPSYGGYPGAEECCISSDDIFWMKKAPGKTLVIGASYIALETAGFLAALGFDTTVMVRSILLRGFDQGIAKRIGDFMARHHCKFIRETVPSSFQKTADGQIQVFVNGEPYDVYDTVFVATGRNGLAAQLNLESAGVEYDTRAGKIPSSELEQTNVPHIYAIGDIKVGCPELTPVAIKAGVMLAARLFAGATKVMDYTDIATTVFTPLEYGCVGLSEEAAIDMFGRDNLAVYHSFARPLEWQTNDGRKSDNGFMKVICKKPDNKVVGIHILGPNAGEVIQGFAVAVKCGLTKEILDSTVGIHPTFAEMIVGIDELKVGDAEPADLGSC
jgi:thioredoxin reductase (NADPH)